MRKLLFAGLAVMGLGGCAGDQLSAPNINNPDINRVTARPSDIETLLGNSFGSAYDGSFGATGGSGSAASIEPALLTMSFESASSLANWAMGPRGGIPRVNTNNTRGNAYQDENARVYQVSQRAARTAAVGLAKLNEKGFTLGSAQQDLRARAIGYFTMGFANATVATAYDSMSVVTETDTIPVGRPPVPSDIKPLASYATAMPIALAQMDSAIAAANRAIALGTAPSGAGGGTGFTLPSSWINGNSFTAAQFIQVVRGFKARFRAEVARTPAERGALDWTLVIADATNGLPVDITMATTAPWRVGDGQHYLFDTWTQQPPMIIGMADSVRTGCTATNAGDPNLGGCYDAWLATPLGSRYAFTIRSKDQRLPPGDTRSAQQTASGSSPSRTNLYFRNRTQTDPPGDPWTLSQYDFYRFQKWQTAGRTGAYPFLTQAELDLLAAEGYLRTNDFGNAMAKINVTRVANGKLPPLAGITSLTQPIAVGAAANSCVPRVPAAPDFAHATCGNIFEALKWEKRMETAYTHLGAWFFDSRGWGDLVQYTPLDFPIPFQETDVRKKPSYSTGGPGGYHSAALGTYGY